MVTFIRNTAVLFAGLFSLTAAAQLAQPESVEKNLKKAMFSFKSDQDLRTKSTVTSLIEQVEGDFEPSKRLQAAILLAAYYWDSNFRLSRHYLGVAEGLRSPMTAEPGHYDAEIQHLRIKFKQAAIMDSDTKNELEKQLNAKPPEPLRLSLVEMLLETNYALNLTKDYLQVFKTTYHAYPRTVRKDYFFKRAAEIYASQGDYTQHFKVLEKLLDQYPITEESRWSLDKLISYSKNTEASTPHYTFSHNLFKKAYRNSSLDPDRQNKILDLVGSPMRKSPDSPATTPDKFDMIRLYCYLQVFDRAMSYVQNLLAQPALIPQERLALQNWAAYILAEKGEHLAALKQYQKSASETIFIESEAKSFMSSKQFSEAALEYGNLLKYKDHPRYRWYYFWNLMSSGSLGSAEKFISKQPHRLFSERDFPQEASRYWQAKILLSAGRVAQARTLLQPLLNRPERNYYSLLARQALIEGEALAAQLEAKKQSVNTANLSEDKSFEQHLSAIPKLASFVPSPPPTTPAVGMHLNPMTPSPSQSISLPFADHIKQLAKSLEVDPYLIMGIVRSESAFNAKALSAAGAQGLMQIMPSTAVRLAKLVDDKEFRLDQLQSGETNLLYGSMYLTLLLDYYKGHAVPAVAAYNAGPFVVDKWLRECRNCPVDAFVEYIPYAETRNYVKKVLTAYATYKSLETRTDPEFITRDLPFGQSDQSTIF